MRTAIALALTALALAGPQASAQSTPAGVNLYGFAGATGSNCDPAGLGFTVYSACGSTGTAMTLMTSVSIPRPLVALAACGQTLDVVVLDATTLPDWWKLDTCRQGATTAAMNAGLAGQCHGTIWDLNPGAAPLVVEGYTQDASGPATLRMQMGASVAVPFDVPANQMGYELAVGTLRIDNSSAACDGCARSACIMLREITLNEDGTADFPHMTVPISANHVGYYGPGGAWPWNCPYIIDPVRNRTWGSLKSLYR